MDEFLPWEDPDWIITPDDGHPAEGYDDETVLLAAPDEVRTAPLDRFWIPEGIDPRLVVIDWITASWPVLSPDLVHGNVMEVWKDDQRIVKRKILPAWKDHPSWSGKIQLRVVGGQCQISGNLNKWMLGHSVHGYTEPSELIRDFIKSQSEEIGYQLAPGSNYDIRLSRIDLTAHYDFKSVERADFFLSALRYVLRARLPGETLPGSVKEYRNTVYWGQNSRNWTMKVYNKFRELKRHYIVGQETLKYWDVPESVLRFELTLRGRELIHHWANLRSVPAKNFYLNGWSAWSWGKTMACAGNWTEEKALGLWMKYVRSRLQAYDNRALPPEGMSHKDLALFRMWQAGDPLDKMYCARQWLRIRKQFKESYLIDLQRPFNPENTSSDNLVSRTLEDLRRGYLHAFSRVQNQIDDPEFWNHRFEEQYNNKRNRWVA